MSTLLVLRSSVNGDSSFSNRLLDEFMEKTRARWPQVKIVERDLNSSPVPALDNHTVAAIRDGVADNPVQQAAIALSETLIAEVKAADYIALGLPRYNFTVPASFNSYIDYIARPGITFHYGEQGPQGLLPDVPVYAFVTSGGAYAGTANDFISSWLKQILGFIGLHKIEFIHAENLATKAGEAMKLASQRIDEILNCS